jgi:3-oxoadipate enol-lactonase
VTTATATAIKLDRGDATIAVRCDGSGPPLLLLHATLSPSRTLERLARLLANSYRVYRVDRRGSGDSRERDPAGDGPIDAATHVADLVALIASGGLGRVAVVGHSYGGCVALELAARHPDLVAWAWVYEPPYAHVGPEEVRARLLDVGRDTAAMAASGGPAAAAMAFFSGVSGADAAASLSPAARDRITREGRAAIADAALQGFDPAGLARIECPVVVATGSNSDAFYDHIADALVSRIPTAQRIHLDGLDHLAPMMDAATIARAVEGSAPT